LRSFHAKTMDPKFGFSIHSSTSSARPRNAEVAQ
jgi:hypothetical protein